MGLIRLAYASEATFQAQPAEKGVEPNVARILMASRTNNARGGIVGGLYYGDDRFFQYLEGEEVAVRALYGRIAKDERHRNVTTLIDEPLVARTFSNWSMKYVPLSSDVKRFLSQHAMARFRPEAFTRAQCDDMIRLIREASEHAAQTGGRSPQAAKPTEGAGLSKSPALVAGLVITALLVIAVAVVGPKP